MRWRVYLFCALTWLFLLPPSLAHAEKTLQERYLEIYVGIHDADQFEQQGDYRSALKAFEDCYTKLQAIHESNPDWEPAMVNARLNDFKVKIADLKPKAEAQQSVPAAQPTPTPTPSELSDDPVVLKQQLSAVQQELITAKQALSTTNQQLDDMTAKYTNSQTELQALHSQLDAVNLQLANQKNQQPVDDQMGKLLAENKDLTDRLAAAEKQVDLVKSPKALALLQTQLKNEKDKLAAAEAQNIGLQQATTTLKQQLDQAQADLATSKQQLASTPTTSPDYAALKHENEIMRDILTNELHEQAHRDMAKRLAQEEFDNLKIKSSVLQQQLDILASPMTPASNDEQRDLLNTLRTSGPEIAPTSNAGNTLAAQVGTPTPTPAPTTENTPATNNTPAVVDTTTNTPTSTDNSTNQPPVTVAIANPTPTPSPADPTPTPNNVTTTAPMDETPANTPAINPPSTNAPTTGPASTTPATTDNSPTASSDNTPTVTHVPDGTTTYTETTIKNNNTSAQSDPSLYANKPVLPDDMKDTAKDAADLFKNGHYDDAAAKYQTIIDKYPESIYAWSNLGVVRFQQGNLPEALKALQQAVKISPSDAFSYRSLGIVYYQMNQYDDAIGALERAIALDPNNVWSHDYLGCACAQKGWQEVAEKEFRKAIDIDETFGEAHFNLAVVYADSKPPALALASRHYNRALELGVPKDPHLEKLLKGL